MKKQDSGWNSAPKTWRNLAAFSLLFLAGAGLFIPPARALTGTINGNVADGQANSDGTVSATTAPYGRLGADAGIRHSVVHVFQIPSAILTDPTQQFSTATYTNRLGSHTTMTPNGDLYGLGYSTSPAISPADFYEGALDATSVLLKDNFITNATPEYSATSESGAALVTHLNDCLASARAAGATNAYVFIRNSLDAYVWTGLYTVGLSEAGGSYTPTLAYNTITVPVWAPVPLGGGGYVTGVVSDPTGDTFYCRTDVGGAFRWSPTGDANGNGAWVSLSDTLVPFGTAGAGALLCVESIAVDPGTPGRLYMAVGNPYISGTARGIYGSDNQGASWYLVDASNTFVIQGNGGSRAQGERLAVDPNNSNILWYGSTTTGLRKFVKSGGTWTATQIPSASVPFGTANTGVTFVVCDQNGGSTIIYAGVADATLGGVYRSTDGGTTWTKVGGAAILSPRRAQIASNGTLYVTAGATGVAKLPRGGSLALLSGLPTGHTYHGVAVDPSDASGLKVFVSSISSMNISRSIDGGSTWFTQTTTFNEGATGTTHPRKEPDGTLCVTGYWFGNTSSLLVNPSDSNELWLGDFFGVSRTRNAQSLGTNPGSWWYTLQKGQEETVALALKSAPTGSKLLTGLSDVGGFYYADTNVRPSGAGGGFFKNPQDANNTSLDFSEGNPNVWARAWVDAVRSTGTGAASSDGGASWVAFGQVSAKTIANNAAAGWETYDIGPYLQQQQALGNTSVTLVVRANTYMVTNAFLHFSSKEGANPPQVLLNGVTTLTPTADAMVNSGTISTNYGNGTELQAQNYYDVAGYVRWSYVKFDLTGQPAITSATLRLYRLASADTNAFPTTIHAIPSSTSWVEGNGGTDNLPAGELTWTNRPTNLTAPPGALWKGGGRIAVSATNSSNLVWLPIRNNTNPTPAYYSKDRGVTWAACAGGPNTLITGVYTDGYSTSPSGQPLAADRGNGYFYLGVFGNSSHIIYRSTNSGANWSQVSTVPNGSSFNMRTPQLVAAPLSPTCPTGGDVWLCDDGTFNNAGGGLWRSTDSAGSWTKLTTVGKVTEVSFGKAASGTGYTVFINGYKGTVKGIYRSDDYGATWVKLPDPTIKDIISLAGDRQNYGKVFIGTDGRGVFQGQ
ncbi:MAG: hypothetical protein WC661_16120 [Opitutaceae bacterium]|jgi:hypothetical protein